MLQIFYAVHDKKKIIKIEQSNLCLTYLTRLPLLDIVGPTLLAPLCNPSRIFWKASLKLSIHILETSSSDMQFFFYQGFLHRHWRFTGQQGKEGDHLSFHSATSTRSLTLRYLFATLHVRWPSHIFNRNASVYHTGLNHDTMFVCLLD